MVPNLLRQVLFTVAFLACFSAQARELFWQYDYQTVYQSEGFVRKAFFDRPLTNIRGNGPPSRSVGYITFDVSKYDFKGPCYVDDIQFGLQLDNASLSEHVTWHWSDGSTLTVKRTSFSICNAYDDQNRNLEYGEYFAEGLIIDGTGRFEGASGTATLRADYRQLWGNEDSFSAIGKIKHTVNLD